MSKREAEALEQVARKLASLEERDRVREIARAIALAYERGVADGTGETIAEMTHACRTHA